MHDPAFPAPSPSHALPALGIRWTIGDVGERGFEALRLSLWGAWHVFGRSAEYVVCVNTLAVDVARERTGPVPAEIAWRDSSQELPAFLARAFGTGMAGGMAWKLAPLRLFPDRHEVSLDNDCILWACPPSLAAWLQGGSRSGACLMAEDVQGCYARFAALCPPLAVNAGLRGLPPGFDLAAALQEAIARCERSAGGKLRFEPDDEQGLQVAALSLAAPLQVVKLEEVTICSPFYPHLPHLGSCGAHFVGLNTRHIPWNYYDRSADDCMTEHWERHRPELLARTGAGAFNAAAADTAGGLVSPPSAGSPPPSRRPRAALLSPSPQPAGAS